MDGYYATPLSGPCGTQRAEGYHDLWRLARDIATEYGVKVYAHRKRGLQRRGYGVVNPDGVIDRYPNRGLSNA